MADRLKVILDAEVDKFNADIKKSSETIDVLKERIQTLKELKLVNPKDLKEQDKLNLLLRKESVELSNQRLELGRTKVAMKAYVTSNAQATTSVQKLTKAQEQFRNQAGSSNAVALEFNRIIQDAPFGIIGIGNNIQQLAGNFSNLKAVSGGTGKAIASALSSIVSPVNLVLLGISAVTSLWTAYSLGAFDSAEATETFAESLEKFVDTLDDVTKARLDGASSAQEEIRRLKELQTQAEKVNLPLEVSLEAVRDLKKEYPELLGQLTDEEILLGNVGDAYKILTKNIIATAKAKSFSNEIGKNAIEILAIEERTTERIAKIIEAREKLERQKRIASSSGAKVAGQVTNVDTEAARTQDLINSLIKEQIADVNIINGIKSQTLTLEGEINKELENGGKFTKTIVEENEKSGKKLKEQKATIEDLIKAYKSYREFFNLPLIVEDIQIKLPDAPPQLDDPGRNAPYEDFTLQVRLLAEAYTQLTQKALEAGQAQLKLEENFQKLLESEALDLLEGGLRDFANSFVDSLNISNNALEGFVSQVIGAVPKIIGAFIKLSAAKKAKAAADLAADQASAIGGAAVVAVEGAKGLGPVGWIALPLILGGLLSVIGGAFKGGGGRGGGGASASVSGNTGQSFTGGGLGFQGFGDLQLSSSIRGTDLVLLINRSGNVNN